MSKYIFTNHAQLKMRERNITEEQILSVIKYGKISTSHKGFHSAKVLYYEGIFIVLDKNKIVTVFSHATDKRIVQIGSISLFNT